MLFLEMKTDAENLMDDEKYDEAEKILTQLIEEYKAVNPYYRFLRAKCYFQMSPNLLNQARRDIFYTLSYTRSKYSKIALILRIKAEYTAAIIESQLGCDPKRAFYHYAQLGDLIGKYGRTLRSDIEGLPTMAQNASDFME